MKLSDAAKKMLLALLCALPLLVGAGALFYRSWAFLPFAGGALLGTALSAAKVILLERTVRKMASIEDKEKAANYVRLQSLLRFLLTGLVLVLPAFAIRWGLPPGVFWGAAAGVLAYQLAVYSMRLFTKKGDNA